jgi:aminoglycoside 6'-N-acetyltransferase I
MNRIRPIQPQDAALWATLRHDLWPDASVEHHAEEITAFFAGTLEEPLAVLVYESKQDGIIAFAELSIRSQAPGTDSNRVAFVEGLYVRPKWRNRGIARHLLRASEVWARHSNCDAFASDRGDRLFCRPPSRTRTLTTPHVLALSLAMLHGSLTRAVTVQLSSHSAYVSPMRGVRPAAPILYDCASSLCHNNFRNKHL